MLAILGIALWKKSLDSIIGDRQKKFLDKSADLAHSLPTRNGSWSSFWY